MRGQMLYFLNMVKGGGRGGRRSVGVGYSGYLCSLQEVADALGVTKSGAAVVERSALKKCRTFLKRRGLTLADLMVRDGDKTEYE